MKWRIRMRLDGRFEIQSKSGYLSAWRDRGSASYKTLKLAQEERDQIIRDENDKRDEIRGRKIVKIVEVIDA
jgi:hypothetical protein